MADVDLDKLRSVAPLVKARGTAKKVIKDERTGGHEVHHWDDRVDAMVVARPVRAGVTVKADNESE